MAARTASTMADTSISLDCPGNSVGGAGSGTNCIAGSAVDSGAKRRLFLLGGMLRMSRLRILGNYLVSFDAQTNVRIKYSVL